MSWDIYGNPLRRGHCEVHPHVHEEYPCSVCMAERNQQQPDYELERLNYELDQQNDYIKELTLSNQNLNMALQKVSDYNLRLENDRDALAKRIAMAERVESIFSDSTELSFDDCKRLFPVEIAEIKAEAINDLAIYICDRVFKEAVFKSEVVKFASEYADKVRQGGE